MEVASLGLDHFQSWKWRPLEQLYSGLQRMSLMAGQVVVLSRSLLMLDLDRFQQR